jgi:hypothetical protein
MSKESIMELTKAVTKRYLKAKGRKKKTKILDEYCANTGLNRKYAIGKIREACFGDRKEKKKRGRKKTYSNEADVLLIQIWKAFDQICGDRLHPYLKEGLAVLNRCGHIKVSLEIQAELLRMSCSSVKRRVSRHRKLNDRVLISTTKPGFLLKKEIRIKTSSWNEEKAGYDEFDLVAHCGSNASGDFINTLQSVDIKTTWTERKAVMGKAQGRVFEAIKVIQNQLPFTLLGFDSDNGSEFINHQLLRYCRDNGIEFTRSRPYMSKDNAHIEQKNWPLVRKILGYHRYDTNRQLSLINDLYDHELRLYLNFFQPSFKLQEKMRIGSKTKRVYGKAKTPYQRVLECEDVPEENKEKLRALYSTLDPIQLKHGIEKKLKALRSLL